MKLDIRNLKKNDSIEMLPQAPKGDVR